MDKRIKIENNKLYVHKNLLFESDSFSKDEFCCQVFFTNEPIYIKYFGILNKQEKLNLLKFLITKVKNEG